MEIGIDSVDISRFKKLEKNPSFLKKVFTEKEIKYCQSKNPSTQHFAVRFAAKEAVIKALSPLKIKPAFTDIEILNKGDQRPFVIFNPKFNKKLDIKISLTHSKNLAIAMAIVDSCKP